MQNMFLAIGIVPVAFLLALAALYAFSMMDRRDTHRLRRETRRDEGSVVFLFDDDQLTDTTPAAQQMMAWDGRNEGESDWSHLAMLLSTRFPNLTEQISELAELGQMTLISNDGSNRIEAEWCNGLARLELVDTESQTDKNAIDRLSYNAMQKELTNLRATSEHVPLMIWREDQNGTITWANRNYLDMAAQVADTDDVASWPPYKLFERSHLVEATELDKQRRLPITLPNQTEPQWFDLHEAPLGDEALFTAIPADRIVKAEKSQKDFVTTLTKTFAHLPIGLAIFDRKRRLTLFNPALNDLANLPIDFLIGRPALFAFLDRLRENRIMPEPRDYGSWRKQMVDLETAAVNGTYQETWALPSGLTYRVTGRPHPDGAVAFLFEDISAETTLTRRFKTELEMGQSVLDGLDQAIAVFSAGGVLSMSNAAYHRLWGDDPTTSLKDVNLADAIKTWREICTDTPVWQQLKEFIATNGERETWTATISLQNGRMLDCRFVPMARGATMASFQLSRMESTLKPSQRDWLPAHA